MSFNPIQLFDSNASIYTYLLVAPDSPHAVMIDPVERNCERDVRLLERLGLTLVFVLSTRATVDPAAEAGRLCQLTGASNALHVHDGTNEAGVTYFDHTVIRFGGNEEITAIITPGLAPENMSYLWRGNVFTGETLLIDDCGSIDPESGCADSLFTSITEKLFTLPEDTRVWPGRDHKGRFVSTIGWEKRHNVRLAARRREDFVRMAQPALPTAVGIRS